MNLLFPHSYDVKLLRELPSTPGKRFYYPGGTNIGGRGGLSIEVSPLESEHWIGTFAATYTSPKALTGIYSCPNENQLCVVSGGAGYIVRADNPRLWEEIPVYPIVDVLPILEKSVLIFLDFSGMVAYGPEGLVWIISNSSWDGIRINQLNDEYAYGTVWDHEQQRDISLIVEITTGEFKAETALDWFSGPESFTTYSSPIKQVIKQGELVELDEAIKQSANVFDFSTYKEFLTTWEQLDQEYKLLYKTIDILTAHSYLERFRQLREEYISRLPLHFLAACPYCKSRVLQPVDSFSLAGLYPMLNLSDIYHGGNEWITSPSPRRRCRHTLLATVSINLNGKPPDDLPTWMLQRKWSWVDSSPRLLVWPLIAQRTSAVIHSLPIARLDDLKPTHHYTAYFVTYFVSDLSNLMIGQMWVPGDNGRPATGGVYYDPNLLKWIQAKRLFWLDPDDPAHLLAGNLDKFPYAEIRPQGRYRIIENGEVEGPHPYNPRFTWQGNAPHHDESFPQTIE